MYVVQQICSVFYSTERISKTMVSLMSGVLKMQHLKVLNYINLKAHSVAVPLYEIRPPGNGFHDICPLKLFRDRCMPGCFHTQSL